MTQKLHRNIKWAFSLQWLNLVKFEENLLIFQTHKRNNLIFARDDITEILVKVALKPQSNRWFLFHVNKNSVLEENSQHTLSKRLNVRSLRSNFFGVVLDGVTLFTISSCPINWYFQNTHSSDAIFMCDDLNTAYIMLNTNQSINHTKFVWMLLRHRCRILCSRGAQFVAEESMAP